MEPAFIKWHTSCAYILSTPWTTTREQKDKKENSKSIWTRVVSLSIEKLACLTSSKVMTWKLPVLFCQSTTFNKDLPLRLFSARLLTEKR